MKPSKTVVIALTTVTAAFIPATASAAPSPSTVHAPMKAPARTQVSVDHTYTRFHVGTPNENESRYSLSLTKLLLADYIYQHGSPADKAKATAMIEQSNDGLASELSAKYPQAIQAKAHQYGMKSAVPASTWGNWKFSSADWSRYISAKHREDPTATGPLLSAMKRSHTHGADGYYQRYGVALLPGVKGWKSGWSDDRTTYHASVGFGNDWTVAIQTNGNAGALNADLNQALNSGAQKPSAPQQPKPLPSGIAMTNYPARGAAKAGFEASKAWVNKNVAPVDPRAAHRINQDIDRQAANILKTVPRYIPVPKSLENFLAPVAH